MAARARLYCASRYRGSSDRAATGDRGARARLAPRKGRTGCVTLQACLGRGKGHSVCVARHGIARRYGRDRRGLPGSHLGILPAAQAAIAAVSWTERTKTCRSQLRWSRSEEHTSELQSLMRISSAVFRLKKKRKTTINRHQKKQL